MIAVLDQIAMSILALGLLAIAVGFFVAMSIPVRVAIAHPNFWKGQFGPFWERMLIRSPIGAIARAKENTTRGSRIADVLLRRGTVLLFAGGIAKAALFLIERQST